MSASAKPKRVIEIWGCPICDADVQKTETRGDRRCPNGHWLRWNKKGEPTDGAVVHYPVKGWVRFRHLHHLQVVHTPDHNGVLGRSLVEGEEVTIFGEAENGFYHIGSSDGLPEYVHMFFVVIPFWFRGAKKEEAEESE